MNIIDLKPCPFCGASATLKSRRLLAADVMRGGIVVPLVLCINEACGATVGPVLHYPQWEGKSLNDLEQMAVEAWNKRA